MDDALLTGLSMAARAAGARIMADWRLNRAVAGVRNKTDGSPVTDTDQAAEIIVVGAIKALSPHPVVGEEAAHAGTAPRIDPSKPFWLVDALDGTREFIRGRRDFTVNIALVERGVPVFGIIHAPAHGVTWYAGRGEGAFRVSESGTGESGTQRIAVRATPVDGHTALAGVRSSEPVVLDPFIGPHTIARREQRSSSIKFCLVADGSADLYARLGPTYEWDTAAGDIILREAGGAVMDLESRAPIAYGKTHRKLENGGFIAAPRAAFTIPVP